MLTSQRVANPSHVRVGALAVPSVEASTPAAGKFIMTSPSGEPVNLKVQHQLGIFDIFKVGIGPSSSHTVGPMIAAQRFVEEMKSNGNFDKVTLVQCDLYGSLALTGRGHQTDKAVCCGLAGMIPATAAPNDMDVIFDRVQKENKLLLGGSIDIDFVLEEEDRNAAAKSTAAPHLIFHFDHELPHHPNGMALTALDARSNLIHSNEYFSIGGGFIKSASEYEQHESAFKRSMYAHSPSSVETADTPSFMVDRKSSCGPSIERIPSIAEFDTLQNSSSCAELYKVPSQTQVKKPRAASVASLPPPLALSVGPGSKIVPYPFSSAKELKRLCYEHGLTVAQLMIENERALTCSGDHDEVLKRLDEVWAVMSECIDRGKKMEGTMPVSGSRRTAPNIYKVLKRDFHKSLADHFAIMDWITLFARCVNEENACGGRVVTAPTNGASGTLPAVLAYYAKFFYRATPQGIRDFLATAAAFAVLIKTNASISGAEAGCQAEVGSACAMAAAGLTAAMGGNLEQVENAAEIGLEHNLGMTCDPIGGLVQVPCIERNCIAAVKAITAHRLAMRGDGCHQVSFDSCVETMYRTGLDMQAKYRETSTGGLALYARRADRM